MKNIKIYEKVFFESFEIDKSILPGLSYQDIPEWDSVGHMNLMNALEEEFNLELDIDDIIDFSSYEKGQEILLKYGVE